MTNYDSKPSILEAKGNGSYFYRWDIREITKTIENKTITSYNCKEVTLWSPITKSKIKKIVINFLWGKDSEQKLINDFNAANEGILDESYIEKYKDFLNERKSIKEQINNDCVTYNIK